MSVEEEIVQALADWWCVSTPATDAEVDVFRPALVVLMPLVKRAQAEAWERGVDNAQESYERDFFDPWKRLRGNPYIENEGARA